MVGMALELRNDVWQIGINPAVGAVVTHGRLLSDAGPWELLRPTSFLGRVSASFPLIPWSNRIGGGALVWGGQHYQLRLDDEPGHTAIHGVVRDYPWSVVSADAQQVQLEFDSRGRVGINWPWSFTAQVTYRLAGPRFVVTTELTNVDQAAFPAGLGHHPYFNRRLTGQPSDEVQLELPCTKSFALTEYLATGPAEPVADHLNFLQPRGFGQSPALDDCLTGRDQTKPARLTYPHSGVVIELEADPLFECYVLYVPQGETDFFALEPVSHANNGLALLAAGVDDTGVLVLEPGQSVQASWSLQAALN